MTRNKERKMVAHTSENKEEKKEGDKKRVRFKKAVHFKGRGPRSTMNEDMNDLPRYVDVLLIIYPSLSIYSRSYNCICIYGICDCPEAGGQGAWCSVINRTIRFLNTA